MFKSLKLKQSENCKVYFSSDLHLDHKLNHVWQKRGFSSVEDHNDSILNNWNNTVRDSDIVFYLGDFSLNSSPERAKEFVNRLNGHIFYIFGNHESNIKYLYQESLHAIGHPTHGQVYPLVWRDKITFLGYYAEVLIDNKLCILQHFPLASWNNQKHGSFMLCGHEHLEVAEIRPEYCHNGKIMDCGADYHLRPHSFDEIRSYMDKKPVKSGRGHH